jgi:hypothetical protein
VNIAQIVGLLHGCITPITACAEGLDKIPKMSFEIRQTSAIFFPLFTETARWGRDSGARMYASSAKLSIFFCAAEANKQKQFPIVYLNRSLSKI